MIFQLMHKSTKPADSQKSDEIWFLEKHKIDHLLVNLYYPEDKIVIKLYSS